MEYGGRRSRQAALCRATLIRRLRDRFAPGGLLHYGQGKWYPGEQLPRWAFALLLARGRQPLWENDALVDREAPAKPADRADAERFSATLASGSISPSDCAMPAYEDPAHFLLMEQQAAAQCRSAATTSWTIRRSAPALAQVFERGLGKPSGYVLPLQAWHSQGAAALGDGRWACGAASCSWCPAIRRSVSACRSTRCPMIAPANYPHVLPSIRSSAAGRLPPARGAAARPAGDR